MSCEPGGETGLHGEANSSGSSASYQFAALHLIMARGKNGKTQVKFRTLKTLNNSKELILS
jgi:hypothetical protein